VQGFKGLFNLQNNGMSYVEFLRKNPNQIKTYYCLTGTLAEQAAPFVLKAVPTILTELNDHNATVTDLGGNKGRILSQIKAAYPNIRAISYDLPEFQEIVKECPPPSVELVSGECCDESAIPMSDCFIISNSLLNFPDEEMIKLLQSLHKRLNKGGKIMHIGVALPEPGKITPLDISGLTWNLHMMQYAGTLRTPSESKKLCESQGFRFVESH